MEVGTGVGIELRIKVEVGAGMIVGAGVGVELGIKVGVAVRVGASVGDGEATGRLLPQATALPRNANASPITITIPVATPPSRPAGQERGRGRIGLVQWGQ